MKEEQQKKNPALLHKYLHLSAAGAARGLIGLPFDHPLEYVKTKIQASPKGASATQIAKDTYKTQGLRGFYAGIGTNTLRVVSKEVYRYPLNIVYARLLVGWATFLVSDEAFKSMARKYHKSHDLPYRNL